MREALDAIGRSGLSLWAYARRHGLSYPTLTHWRRRVAGKTRRRSESRSAPAVFVEAVASKRASAEDRFEIELRGGARILVPAQFDAEALRSLVSALEPPC